MNKRGVYQHKERAKQLLLYEGMQYMNITPTDIDGCIEYHNKAWFFYEIKEKGTPIKMGQRIALERLVKDTSTAGKYSIAIIAEHEEYDTEKPVYLKDCVVRELKIGNEKWRPPNKPMTVKEITDLCIDLIDKGNNP